MKHSKVELLVTRSCVWTTGGRSSNAVSASSLLLFLIVVTQLLTSLGEHIHSGRLYTTPASHSATQTPAPEVCHIRTELDAIVSFNLLRYVHTHQALGIHTFRNILYLLRFQVSRVVRKPPFLRYTSRLPERRQHNSVFIEKFQLKFIS